MRSFGVRLPILAATAWAGIGFSVFGMDFGYSETVYVTPTVATVAWPTSYVASRSYLVPTAYSFPSYIRRPTLRTGHAGADLLDDRIPGQEGTLRPASAGRETAVGQLSADHLRVANLLRNFLSA